MNHSLLFLCLKVLIGTSALFPDGVVGMQRQVRTRSQSQNSAKDGKVGIVGALVAHRSKPANMIEVPGQEMVSELPSYLSANFPHHESRLLGDAPPIHIYLPPEQPTNSPSTIPPNTTTETGIPPLYPYIPPEQQATNSPSTNSPKATTGIGDVTPEQQTSNSPSSKGHHGGSIGISPYTGLSTKSDAWRAQRIGIVSSTICGIILICWL